MSQRTKYIFLALLLITLVAFSSNANNYIKKLKTLTQVIRLVNENYVEEVDMNDVLDGAIIGLLDKLDPHSSYLSIELLEEMQENFSGEFEGIGIEFSIIDGYITIISPIPETPSDRAGLLSGDKIVKIDGESAYKITQKDVFNKLRGPKNSKVNITIRRGGVDDFDVALIRAKIPIHSLLASFMIDNETGYVKINRFSHTTIDEFKDALDDLEQLGMSQLMIDLRNNPGGLMNQAVQMIDMFIDSRDKILFTKGRIRGSSRDEWSSRSVTDKKYPVIVLINRGSASASEIVAGALQDLDRGLVVGETSFGKGSVQNLLELNDGSAIKLTIAKYYTPSGRSIQRPYDKGVDEYYLDLNEDNRESLDSLDNDSPVFKTKSGRTVYGGGGITPDIFVESDMKLSKSISLFITSTDRLLFNFSEKIKNDNSMNEYLKSNSINEFINNYKLSSNYKKDLTVILEELDDEFIKEHLNQDWNFIENRIKAQIANSIWGKSAMYQVNLKMDKVAMDALEQFPSARLLIK